MHNGKKTVLNKSVNDVKYHEKCGIIGFWNNDDFNPAEIIYLGLYGIQHRGQQSCGIAVNDGETFIYNKNMGLVSEVFDGSDITKLVGEVSGLGHVGYNVEEENTKEYAQPLVLKYKKGQMAISYNGCLLNSRELRTELERQGHVFQSASDAEIIAILLSKERAKHNAIEKALVKVMKKIVGAYSILIMTPRKIVAARDAKGMKPLCIGTLKDSYIFCSETSSFDTVGAKRLRDVLPGEVVVAGREGLSSIYTKKEEKSAMCIFEFIYLARTDSHIDGESVYLARKEAGKFLAKEYPVEADIVIGVPDSAIPAAIGYSMESGIVYAEGLVKNRYIGRTFIQPSQKMRETAVMLKLNTIKSQIEGKRVVLVDDSIVRGTTMKKIVQMLKDSGAVEIHIMISSPHVKHPCIYGIDTSKRESLIANRMTDEEICGMVGADSLSFLSIESLAKITPNAKCGFCKACFDGNYPLARSGDES